MRRTVTRQKIVPSEIPQATGLTAILFRQVNSKKLAFTAISSLLFQLISVQVQASVYCTGPCAPLKAKVGQKATEILKLKDLLKKNEDYLITYPNAGASVQMKIKSNLLMTKLKIEIVQNEQLAIQNELKSKNCGDCIL